MNLRDQMDADLDKVFFNSEDFAEECTYRPIADEAYAIKGIFDSAHEEVTPGGMTSVSSIGPTLVFSEKILKAKISRKDTVTVRGFRYAIKDSQPDGTGVVTLLLSELFAEQ